MPFLLPALAYLGTAAAVGAAGIPIAAGVTISYAAIAASISSVRAGAGGPRDAAAAEAQAAYRRAWRLTAACATPAEWSLRAQHVPL